MSKRENEKAIFSAFLRVAPDFAGEEIADWKQPTDSKDTMLQPLLELLAEKKEHYSSAGAGFHHLTLMIYYNSALIYNSPAETPTFTFEDAVREARTFIGDDPDPFTSIYLFLAIDEGRVLKIV